MPTCSIIVPWCDRPELAVAMSQNHALLGRRDDVEVVVCSTGRTQMLTSLMAVAGAPYVRCVEMPGASFNRSLCINVGAFVSKGDYLLLLDGDMLYTADFLDEAYDRLERGGCYLSMRYIYESSPIPEPDGPDWSLLEEVVRTKELKTRDGRRAVMVSRNKQDTRPGDGQVMVARRHAIAIGGMNGSFVGWGFDDTDFQIRLQLALGLECVELGEITHMTHHGGSRDFRQWRRNSDHAYENYRNGNFLGTYEADVTAWRDRIVELAPVWAATSA